MDVSFRDEPLDSPSARRLLDGFTAAIAALYPGWSPSAGPSARPEDFAPPSGRFIVAYASGQPLGCGGLKRLDDHAVEVKRLYVAPDSRGRGTGRLLLQRLEQIAAESDYSVVRLDTGNRQPEALALFRSAGYREIGDYNGNPFASYWFEKEV
jgi:GNAT superfamily N-acetyltransferase